MASTKIVKLAEEYQHVKQLPKSAPELAPKFAAPKAPKTRIKPKVIKRAKKKGAAMATKAIKRTEQAAKSAKVEAAGPIKRLAIRGGRAVGGVGKAAGLGARAIGFGLKAAGKASLVAGTFESGYQVGSAMREGVKAVKAHGHLQRTRKQAREKYGVTTTQKTLLSSKLLHGLVTGDPGLKVKYEQRKRR